MSAQAGDGGWGADERVPARSMWAPMLAVAGPLPGPDREGEFAFETWWNGARVIVHLPGDGTVRLWSPTGTDVTAGYPELGELAGLLPRGLEAVLDGEIVAVDGRGLPSVGHLQERMSLHHPTAVARAVEELPVRLMLYDVLVVGQPVVHTPYIGRRALLDDLALTGEHVRTPAAMPGLASEAFAQAVAEGFDGVVAKRLTSPYLPGRRSRDWIKARNR